MPNAGLESRFGHGNDIHAKFLRASRALVNIYTLYLLTIVNVKMKGNIVISTNFGKSRSLASI